MTPENVALLVLAWRLQCAAMAHFTLAEWTTGMRQLQCDNTAKLKVPFFRATGPGKSPVHP